MTFVGGEKLRPTGRHPLYSLDRNDWVRVQELQIGERLQTAEGAVAVEALEKVRGLHRVYNFEVEGDHEYLVGESGVRSHNSSALNCGNFVPLDKVRQAARAKSLLAGQSKKAIKHSLKHLEEFRALDPNITGDSLRALGAKIAANPANRSSATNAVRATFDSVVNIGGKDVTVRSVLNEAGRLRSIHIRN